MAGLNKNTQQLIKELSLAKNYLEEPASEEVVKTSKAASLLAIVYESARNAVEFRAEHLIRQGAIARILKRRLFLNQPSRKLASLLVRELIWARYLKSATVPVRKVDKVGVIIDKYRFVISQSQKDIVEKKKSGEFTEWLIGLASCEIEEELVFNPIPQIFINYVFTSLSKRLDFQEGDPETKSAQIYIATERGFAKNSETLISFRLLKTTFPSWFSLDPVLDQKLYDKLMDSRRQIQELLSYPLADNLRRAVVKMSPPFNLIREILEEYPEDFQDIATDQELLEKTSRSVLTERYDSTREKLNRASTRSIVYIFLTKMVLGIILELPFDMFLGKPNYLALGINSLFPPALMFLLSMNVKLPDEENSLRMVNKVKEYFYDDSKKNYSLMVEKSSQAKSKRESLFFSLYLITFFLIFGGIIWLLRFLDFNFVSIVIFIFFLSVVSFFAYRIRGIAKDYFLAEEEKESLGTSLMDFVFLPIVRVGQWLSIQISYLNLLSFIFDFIIEAPLKAFLEVFEEWIHFVRIKKEEIVN